MQRGTRNNSQEARDRARKLRAEMSVSERILWMFIRGDKTGFRFRTQHAVGPYVLDFYCPEAGLCVEVDGELHHGRAREDEARDVWLETRGILTMRIPSEDIYVTDSPELARWIGRIRAKCEQRTGRQAFPD